MSSLADLAALKLWPGVNITDEQEPSAQAVLDAASAIIRAEAGQAWDTEVPELAAAICVAVAARVWKNPNGVVQQSTGPFSGSVAQWAAAGLVLTDDEKHQLADLPGSTGHPKLWTLSTTRGDVPDTKSVLCGYGAAAAEYLPVDPSGKDMPWLADSDLPA